MTKQQPPSRSRLRTIALTLAALSAAIGLLVFGGWIGIRLLGPRTSTDSATSLSEVQTNGGTYVGHIVSDDGTWVTLGDAAVVTVEAVPSGAGSQVVVRSLSGEPYGLGTQIRVSRRQVVFVGDVASDSQLAAAYRKAVGGG